MAQKKAKLYFAVFSELTQEGLESSRKFFEENGDLINYKDIFFPENFYKLKDILSKDSVSQEEFEAFNYDRPDNEDDDVSYMILHLRYVWDLVSLGRVKEKLAKEYKNEFELSRLIDEAIKLYGLTEEERSIFHIADHRDDEERMLEFIRKNKQTAWERDVLYEIVSSLLVDDVDIFNAMRVAIVDAKHENLKNGLIDDYSYPESVLELLIKNDTLKKNFFNVLDELVEESKEIVEDPNKDIQ